MYAQQVAAEPIRALIISPDSSYRVQEVHQDLRSLQALLGGDHFLEAAKTPHATLWFDQEAKLKGLPFNQMATFLWWKLCPEMTERASVCGPCFVTGFDDDYGDLTSVGDAVLALYDRLRAGVRHASEGPDPSGKPAR